MNNIMILDVQCRPRSFKKDALESPPRKLGKLQDHLSSVELANQISLLQGQLSTVQRLLSASLHTSKRVNWIRCTGRSRRSDTEVPHLPQLDSEFA